jgi:hypothetical protein
VKQQSSPLFLRCSLLNCCFEAHHHFDINLNDRYPTYQSIIRQGWPLITRWQIFVLTRHTSTSQSQTTSDYYYQHNNSVVKQRIVSHLDHWISIAPTVIYQGQPLSHFLVPLTVYTSTSSTLCAAYWVTYCSSTASWSSFPCGISYNLHYHCCRNQHVNNHCVSSTNRISNHYHHVSCRCSNLKPTKYCASCSPPAAPLSNRCSQI